MNLVDNFYREEILDYYQHPRNFGKLPHYDAYARQTNSLCGDDIEIWIKFNKISLGVNRNPPPRWIVVKEINFLGKGCAICIASASMLTAYAKDRSKKELTKFGEQDMLRLLGIEVSQTRKKCALLALTVLKDIINAL